LEAAWAEGKGMAFMYPIELWLKVSDYCDGHMVDSIKPVAKRLRLVHDLWMVTRRRDLVRLTREIGDCDRKIRIRAFKVTAVLDRFLDHIDVLEGDEGELMTPEQWRKDLKFIRDFVVDNLLDFRMKYDRMNLIDKVLPEFVHGAGFQHVDEVTRFIRGAVSRQLPCFP